MDFAESSEAVYGLVVRTADGRIFRSLEPTSGVTDLLLAASIDGKVVVRVRHTDIAFTMTPFERLARDVEEVEQLPAVPLPNQDNSITCLAFNPDASSIVQMQYLYECRPHIPLGYTESTPSWPTTGNTVYYQLPSNWEVAPSTAASTISIVANYSKYWNAANDCWPSKAGCADSWSYVRNSTGGWCVSVGVGAGKSRPILRRLSVDTRCHLDNYGATCNSKGNSRVSIGEIPLDPLSIFVNLRGGTVANFTIKLPGYTGTTALNTQAQIQLNNVAVLDLVLLLDATTFAGTNIQIAKSLISDYAIAFANSVKTALSSRGTAVNFAFAYWDGSATTFQGMAAVKPVANLAAADILAPQNKGTSSFYGGVTTWASSSFTWSQALPGVGDYMRIAVLMSANNPSSYTGFATMNTALKDRHIFPYAYTTTGNVANFNGMKTAIPWTRTCSTCSSAFDTGGLSSNSNPTWDDNVVFDIASSSQNLIGSTYVYVAPNDKVFFEVDKAYASGNDKITVTANDKCYCYPPIYGKNFVPPTGFYLCSDVNMPCATSVNLHKIFICHVPPGDPTGGKTSSVGYSSWGGHGDHPYDGIGSCDCFQYDGSGTVTVGDVTPESLYDMSPDHYYGNVYVFGHDTRKTYVTVPSAPWLPVNENTITVSSGSTIVFNFVEGPNMVVDENGYVQSYQIIYVGYTGIPPSINTTTVGLKTYPEGTPIVVDSRSDTAQRICPTNTGSGIQITPPCPPDGSPLIVRYRVCNGCFCQESGSEGYSTLIVRVTCVNPVAPTCRNNETLPTIYTFDDRTAVATVDLDDYAFDANVGDAITITVSNVGAQALGTLAFNSATNVVTFTATAGSSGTASIIYQARDATQPSAVCTLYIPIVRNMSAPEIYLAPSLQFYTPRETTSTVYTITVKYNPGVLVGIYASNGQWLPDSMIYDVKMDATEIRNLTTVEVLEMDSNYQGTTTLYWRPSQYHTDLGQSNVTFTAVAADGATSTPITATFRVTPNNAPTTISSTVSTNEDTPVTFGVRCTDVDSYHTYKLTIVSTSQPANGAVSSTGSIYNVSGYTGTVQNFTFTPNLNWNGATSFTYQCTDNLGASTTGTVTINVAPVNDPPTSQNYVIYVKENDPTTFSIRGTDIDGDAISLAFSNVSGLAGPLRAGSNQLTDGESVNGGNGQYIWSNLVYTRPAGGVPSEVVAFTINDGTVNSVTYTVTILTIEAGPPTCTNAQFTTAEDNSVSFSLNSNFASPAGAAISDLIIFTGLANPSLGRLTTPTFVTISNFPYTVDKTNNIPNQIVFVPEANAVGSTTFQYYFRDNTYNKTASSLCTATVTATAVNDPPTLSVTPLDVTLNRTSSQVFTVTVTDIDSPSVTVSWADKSFPSNSALTTSNGALSSSLTIGTFPLTGGSASFTVTWSTTVLTPAGSSGYIQFTAVDNSGLAAAAPYNDDRVVFRVVANDPPVHFSHNVPTYVEDQVACGNLQVVGTDPNRADYQQLLMQVVTGPQFGTINQAVGGYVTGAAHADGTSFNICYKPSANFNGNDYIEVQYRDPLLAESQVARIPIVVLPANDPPTSQDIYLSLGWAQNASFSITGADIDGDILKLYIFPNVSGLQGTVKFTFPEPDETVNGAKNISVSQDSWTFQYTSPSANVNESFVFVVNDGKVDSRVYTVFIAVDFFTNFVNQPPTTTNGTYTTNEDTPIAINLDLHSIDDADGHNILLQIQDPISGATIGTLRNSAGDILVSGSSLLPAQNHTVVFTPAPDYCGSATFAIRAADSAGLTSNPKGYININVVCVNDPPTWVVVPETVTGVRGSAVTYTYTIQDIDSPSTTMTITAAELKAFPSGSIVVIGGRSVDLSRDFVLTVANPNPGTPVNVEASWTAPARLADDFANDYNGQLVDSSGLAASDTIVNLRITSNIAPVAYDYSVTILENSGLTILPLNCTDADAPHNRVLVPSLVAFNSFGVGPAFGISTGPFITSMWADGTRYNLTYTVDAGFYGEDSFYFVCTDLVGAVSNYARVTVTIEHVNHPPTCRSQTVRIQTGLNRTLTLVGEDPDVNDNIGFTLTNINLTAGQLYSVPVPPFNAPSYGSLIIDAQPWQLFLNATVAGNFSVSFVVTDDYETPASSAACFVHFYISETFVEDIPLPPDTTNETIYIDEDSLKDFDFNSIITDPEGNPITEVYLDYDPGNPLLVIINGDGSPLLGPSLYPTDTGAFPIKIVPNPNQNGQFIITYTAYNDKGLTSTNTVTIIVNPVNDPPTITVDPTSLLLARTIGGSVSFTITDIDSTQLSVKVLDNSVPVNSTLTYAGASGAVTIVGTDLIYNHSGVTPATKVDYLVWTPLISIVDGASGSFTLQVSDGSLTGDSVPVILSVIPNNVPTTTGPDTCVAGIEETKIDIIVGGTDLDGFDRAELEIVIIGTPRHGVLTYGNTTLSAGDVIPGNSINGGNASSNTLSYTPRLYYRGSDSFDFVVRDHAGAISVPRTVCINITTFVDHPPISSNYELNITEGYCVLPDCVNPTFGPKFVNVFTSDFDGDATTVKFTTVGDSTKGQLLYFNGSDIVPVVADQVIDLSIVRLYYQPAPFQFGEPYVTATFVVVTNPFPNATVVNSIPYTVTVNVAPVNDPPVGQDATYIIDMNEQIDFRLDHDDIDSPVEQLRIEILDMPSTNEGYFYISANLSEGRLTGGFIDTIAYGFNLTFIPFEDKYNENGPIATLSYAVWDETSRSREIYYIKILVGFVPYNLTYRNDTDITALEDIEYVFQVDRYGVDYGGGNEGLTDVTLYISNVVERLNGTFAYCDQFFRCTNITGSTAIPRGAFLTYVGGKDLFGDNALTFTLTLTPSTGAPPLVVPFTISVLPVNDAPVIFPEFNLVVNECDEDTYIIIKFHATDVDNLLSELNGDVVSFLYQGVNGDYFNCNGNNPNKTLGDCMIGDVLRADVFAAAANDANYSFIFIPKPNQNGKARLLIQVVDPEYATSAKVAVEILVNPINDPPYFTEFESTLGKAFNSSLDEVTITSEVDDIDFSFGYNLSVTYTLLALTHASGNTTNVTKREIGQEGQDWATLGHFEYPAQANASGFPCVIADDRLSINCNDKVERVNSWLRLGLPLVFEAGVTSALVELNVDDLGNIDKTPNRPLNASEFLQIEIPASSLGATIKPPTDNLALIIAPIAGLLAGAIIAGVIFALRRNQAKAAVENYFDKFALAMEGQSNTSPLYQGATKGGESPIYRAGQ